MTQPPPDETPTGSGDKSKVPHAVVCLVTTPQTHAHPIAEAILERELAACVNIVPLVQSVYRWRGKIERDDEALLIVKTTSPTVPRIDELLHTVHPYDTFELVCLDVTAGSRPYLDWIAESVGDGSHTGGV